MRIAMHGIVCALDYVKVMCVMVNQLVIFIKCLSVDETIDNLLTSPHNTTV